jgi:hypothetical protein
MFGTLSLPDTPFKKGPDRHVDVENMNDRVVTGGSPGLQEFEQKLAENPHDSRVPFADVFHHRVRNREDVSKQYDMTVTCFFTGAFWAEAFNVYRWKYVGERP